MQHKSKKEKIVIIGANCFQNPLILKAKEMGFETHVFAWKEGSIGEKTADFFYPISIVEKETILKECRKIQPKAITTIASDLAAITVNYIANRMGFLCNSEHSMLIASNKYEMRKTFISKNIDTPKFCMVSKKGKAIDLPDFQYPVIVKPTDRSGSRAITKVESPEGLEKAIQEAIENSFEKKAIIEEYLEGEEFSCECISFEGEHDLLQLTKKYTTGAPRFIETGHIQPSGLDEVMTEKVKDVIFKALDALEIKYGASHAEFKIASDGSVKIIEIGARMGGDCIGSDLVQISTGFDFLKMVIDIACGKKPEFNRVREEKVAVIKFIFTEKDIEQLELIKKNNIESLYAISEIDECDVELIVDSSKRRGYYILELDSEEVAREYMEGKAYKTEGI